MTTLSENTRVENSTNLLTPELIEAHGLLPEEYAKIQKFLGRQPNTVELAMFSVMWSEHCAYKNSKPLLRLLPTAKADPQAPNQVLVKAGEENAGIIDIGDGWAVCFKIESHNHPSAIEPFEGAATGVGGILRDIFTMGARPVLLTNSLRFGSLASATTRRLFRGVVAGIAHYGNCVGVPTVGGDISFDDSYEGNPLVNALCLGVLRHDQIQRGAAAGVGNPVFYVGAATGRDGLGGAAFASRELSSGSTADRPAVQKGDPFMGKLLIESCLEMMSVEGLVVGVQDMGAAGLTCSGCETAARGGAGIILDLDRVPQRESGMDAREILLSESQERMLVIVRKGREAELQAIFDKWDLHAVPIGHVTDGCDMVVRHGGAEVARVPAAALVDEAPVYTREAREPAYLEETRAWTPTPLPDLTTAAEAESVLPRLLADPTIASKRWVWQQYDHMVLANTVVEPGSDAAVVRLRLDKGNEKFLAVTNDGNHRYSSLDPYHGAQAAIAEGVRNLACSGARPLAMTNNLNFGNPYKPEAFYMLRESVKGLADACTFWDLPVVGGNVSLYNESPRGAIDPTPIVGIVGLIEKRAMITRHILPSADCQLILLGGLPWELGGSCFLYVQHKLKVGPVPKIDMGVERRQNNFLLEHISAGHIRAAHDVSEGGLLVAIAEMLFGTSRSYGASLTLKLTNPSEQRRDALLYGESQGRIVAAVAPDAVEAFLAAAASRDLSAVLLGACTEEPRLDVMIQGAGMTLQWDVNALQRDWESGLSSIMDGERFDPEL